MGREGVVGGVVRSGLVVGGVGSLAGGYTGGLSRSGGGSLGSRSGGGSLVVLWVVEVVGGEADWRSGDSSVMSLVLA